MSLTEFCRLCGTLLLSKRVKMFHIMPETLRLKIFTIIPYNISMDDKLPKDCCYKCIDTLKEFVSFVDKSWTIQKTFFRRATLELKEASTEETSNLPYPTNWYEDNSPNISIGVGNKTRPADKEEKQNKESEKQKQVLEEQNKESEEQNKASQEENKESKEQNKASQEENKESEERSKESEKQSKESEKQSKESEKQSKGSEKQSKESEEQNKDSEAGQSANRNDTGRKKSEEKDRDKSPDRLDNDVSISKNKLAKEPNAESDDNVSIVSSVRSSQDENHMKKKKKWNQRNPFCKPSKYKKRGKGGWRGGWRGGGRKRQTEAEKLVADNIEHYGGEPAPSCSSFLQLFVDGELTSVERKQSDFKSSSFIMSCIPGFGIVYACTKCDVMFTSETPAMVHECDGGYNPAASIASTELTGKGSQYMCQMCDQSFPRRVALESHLASHLMSDVTDDEAPPVKSRRRRRSSSDLELKLYKRREWSSDEVARKKARFRRKGFPIKHTRDSDHSDVDIMGSGSSDSDISSALDSDNFIVDDDVVEYDDDFIVHDEEEINRRRLKSKKQKKKKRSNSSSRRAKYLFF